jgi:hypothetical protein
MSKSYIGAALGVVAALASAAALVALDGGEARPYGAERTIAEATPDPDERGRRMFAGGVDGTDALIGLAIEPSGRVVAYVCDGDPDDLLSDRYYGKWYSGKLVDGTMRLAAATRPGPAGTLLLATNAVTGVRARQTASGFAGTVRIADGSSSTFSAEAATAPPGCIARLPRPANGALGGFSDLTG